MPIPARQTSLVLIDGLAIGVAEGLRIGPKLLTASPFMAMIWRLAAPAFRNRVLANLAAPFVELLEAILGAKRVVMVIGRDRQFGAATLIATKNTLANVASSATRLLGLAIAF